MRGTRGYLAPEWISGVPITAKADVFSYGMMLFELISGRRNADHAEEGMSSFFPNLAANKLHEGDVQTLLDSRLNGDANADELIRACKAYNRMFYHYSINHYKRTTSKKAVIWVANRDNPVTSATSPKLKISEDGYLVLLDKFEEPKWSSNGTWKKPGKSVVAVLLNNGNLILRDQVYKGSLPNSQLIALKKLQGMRQGDKQFQTEVKAFGRIHHTNPVRLKGLCLRGDKSLLALYHNV
ncbi:hypothetical protein E2562_000924 [Oryza meyeriana var. granulata]|uniref:non-specific serine/threonine protein kinase n=1 Tax=Oryza meyeriana var. granulata TaxID=110450 RepID=A0A6G1CYH0_9ORYZ|nr:hypothetical protein E2562_000924 [Oryza meyeriana var. granulata]